MPWIREGKAEIEIPEASTVPTRKMKVFYNPRMKLGRDLTVAIVEAYGRKMGKKIKALFPLAGSGIRAFRLLKEGTVVEWAVINDINPNAAEMARRNAEHNGVSSAVEIENRDASVLMQNFAERKDRFDYIDIDPFGSPLPFLDAAIAAAAPNALLGVTATDIGTLSGIYPERAARKYRMFLHRMPVSEETAVRALLEIVARAAAARERGIVPVLSVVSYFVRVMVIVTSKPPPSPMYLGWCTSCMKTMLVESPSQACPDCGAAMMINGPLWGRQLHEPELLSLAVGYAPDTRSQNIIKKAATELSTLPLVETHHFCSYIRAPNLPSLDRLVESLKKYGYLASRSAIVPTGIRTNAPSSVLRQILLG